MLFSVVLGCCLFVVGAWLLCSVQCCFVVSKGKKGFVGPMWGVEKRTWPPPLVITGKLEISFFSRGTSKNMIDILNVSPTLIPEGRCGDRGAKYLIFSPRACLLCVYVLGVCVSTCCVDIPLLLPPHQSRFPGWRKGR